jgi:glutamyl-tRNA synthetase
MSVVVRFAPSPTGLLHIGNARPALLNWLFARRRGGRFVLRLDDTDRERSTPAFAAAIVEDLAWLGVAPHHRVAQSERLALYDDAVARLKAASRLYPCYETADELERRRRRQIARGLPPIYDRAALALTGEDRARLEADGRRPHWRFRLDAIDVAFDDLVRGEVHVRADSLSDPVLVRADGSYLYTLPSVVDDVDLAITDVIRGEDHVVNTGVQIQIFRALGAEPPRFGHVNLLTTATGEGLSKRSGALSLRSLREDGIEPMAVAALATLIGTSDRVEPVADLDDLVRLVDLAHVSRAPAKFDPADLAALNAKLVHGLAFERVADRLAALGVGGGAAFWNAVRGNLTRVGDAAAWWRVVTAAVAPAIDDADRAFLAASAAQLPPEPWTGDTWGAWTGAAKAASGRSGKPLFQPIRRALTGLEHGPEMKALLPFIGRERAQARLLGRTA